MNKSMELNDTIWQHVLYRLRMWKDAGYRIGGREAFLNAVAIIYWHLTIRHGENFSISFQCCSTKYRILLMTVSCSS